MEGVRWVINSFSPFKSPGLDVLVPVLLWRGLEEMGSRLLAILVLLPCSIYLKAVRERVVIHSCEVDWCNTREWGYCNGRQ